MMKRNGCVSRNYDRKQDAGFREDHMVTFCTNAAEAVGLKDFCQSLVVDRAKFRHAPAVAKRRLAAS